MPKPAVRILGRHGKQGLSERFLQGFAHAEAANGKINTRAPLLEAKALWPLAGSLNVLLTRTRRVYQAERELAQTYDARPLTLCR